MEPKSLKAAIIMGEAKSYWQAGQYDSALECMEQALEIFSETNDHYNTAACLQNIGLIHFANGDATACNEAFEQALIIAQKYRYDDIAQSLNKNLDTILQSMGVEYQPAKKTFIQKLFKK